MNKRNNYLWTAVAAFVALVIGGVIGYGINGTDSNDSSTASGASISSVADRATATAHNAQDVHFAQMMISHHTQAVSMAKMADMQASSSQVKTLASQIEAAQGPEITMMTGWLKSWGESTGMDSMSGMDMSGDMPGSMSQADMDKLSKLSGSAFDKQFLTMMTEHHNGAITMAKDELSKGKYGDALGLAASIQVTQQAQVKQMQSLLKQV